MRHPVRTMKTATPWPCAVLLILAMLSAPAVPAAAPDEARQYDIELLIFRNLVNSDDGEAWPLDLSDYAFGDSAAGEPSPAAPQDIAPSRPKTTTPPAGPAPAWLPADAWQLKNAEDALKRAPNYRPLLHLAWRQAVPPRTEGRPVDLPPPDAGRDGEHAWVGGTATVSLGRYLHLALNLQLHPGLADLEAAGLDEFEIPQFRLTESRRMRTRELHYFDHPRFGVLAIITPSRSMGPDSIDSD